MTMRKKASQRWFYWSIKGTVQLICVYIWREHSLYVKSKKLLGTDSGLISVVISGYAARRVRNVTTFASADMNSSQTIALCKPYSRSRLEDPPIRCCGEYVHMVARRCVVAKICSRR